MQELSRRQFISLTASVAMTGLSGCNRLQGETVKTFTYKNPIINRYLADPCIIKDNGWYYLFATGRAEDGRFIQIYKSNDLTNWNFVRGAVARGAEGSWNRRNFWAPEVIKLNGKYHLYYTGSLEHTPKNTGNRVGLALADRPEGPYEDRGPVVPNASLDGHPFLDSDGTLYLYYTIEHGNSLGLTAGQIYVDKLTAPGRIADEPKQLISHHSWQEGPFILKRDKTYFLTYSTGAWGNDTYNLRYAIGYSPTGPFTEQSNKILQSTEYVKGPGHHSFFTGPDGKTWLAYHGWDPAFTARYPRIDPLIVSGSRLSSPGPTSTKQSYPLGRANFKPV
ncbi:MAG: glycoside hydrolase family 43 protein [Planctomycetota bacterium]|jgi:beta-xylosidase